MHKKSFIFLWGLIFSVMGQLCSKNKKPNMLILYADDLGYGDLKILNPKSKIPTPHLEKLAKEGMIFTDGHSSSGIYNLLSPFLHSNAVRISGRSPSNIMSTTATITCVIIPLLIIINFLLLI